MVTGIRCQYVISCTTMRWYVFRLLDINECKIGMAKCADGTKCFNIPGSYHCEPCSGIQYSIVVITISGYVDSIQHYVIKFVSELQ
jgi:hypothetical protein